MVFRLLLWRFGPCQEPNESNIIFFQEKKKKPINKNKNRELEGSGEVGMDLRT